MSAKPPALTSRWRSGAAAHTLLFAAGETIFREDELGTEMYIVHQGQVEIVHREGGDERSLALLEQGDFFGETAIFDDLPRSATARARTDCVVVEVRRPTFVQMLRSNPEIAVRMMRKLTQRLRETDELLRRSLAGEGRAEPPPARAMEAPAAPSAAARSSPGRVWGELLSDSTGGRFALDREAVSIGRHDPVTGVRPDVDLSAIDTDRTSSRRHARLARDGVSALLTEEIGVMNGTFVNGRRLANGVPAAVHSGDRLRFGRVELIFAAV
jgi:CRP-like cAMP-binding protein